MSAQEASETAAAAPLESEDAARAAFYGLIARLFYAPPDQQLLGHMLHMGVFNEVSGDAEGRGRKLVARLIILVSARRTVIGICCRTALSCKWSCGII